MADSPSVRDDEVTAFDLAPELYSNPHEIVRRSVVKVIASTDSTVLNGQQVAINIDHPNAYADMSNAEVVVGVKITESDGTTAIGGADEIAYSNPLLPWDGVAFYNDDAQTVPVVQIASGLRMHMVNEVLCHKTPAWVKSHQDVNRFYEDTGNSSTAVGRNEFKSQAVANGVDIERDDTYNSGYAKRQDLCAGGTEIVASYKLHEILPFFKDNRIIWHGRKMVLRFSIIDSKYLMGADIGSRKVVVTKLEMHIPMYNPSAELLNSYAVQLQHSPLITMNHRQYQQVRFTVPANTTDLSSIDLQFHGVRQPLYMLLTSRRAASTDNNGASDLFNCSSLYLDYAEERFPTNMITTSTDNNWLDAWREWDALFGKSDEEDSRIVTYRNMGEGPYGIYAFDLEKLSMDKWMRGGVLRIMGTVDGVAAIREFTAHLYYVGDTRIQKDALVGVQPRSVDSG